MAFSSKTTAAVVFCVEADNDMLAFSPMTAAAVEFDVEAEKGRLAFSSKTTVAVEFFVEAWNGRRVFPSRTAELALSSSHRGRRPRRPPVNLVDLVAENQFP